MCIRQSWTVVIFESWGEGWGVGISNMWQNPTELGCGAVMIFESWWGRVQAQSGLYKPVNVCRTVPWPYLRADGGGDGGQARKWRGSYINLVGSMVRIVCTWSWSACLLRGGGGVEIIWVWSGDSIMMNQHVNKYIYGLFRFKLRSLIPGSLFSIPYRFHQKNCVIFALIF